MERPLKIAVVAACPFPYPRGTPYRILRAAEALLQRGHSVEVFTYDLYDPGIATDLTIHRARVDKFYTKVSPGPSLYKLAVMLPRLIRLMRPVLRERNFEVVHAHHYEGTAAALAARPDRDLPVVFDFHTLLYSELPSYVPALARGPCRFVARQLDRQLPRRADHCVTVTDKIEAMLVEGCGVPAERVTWVPNGVELEAFEDVPALPEAASTPPRIVFTGNLAAYQRIDLLLAAFAELVRDGRTDAKLVIASDDSFAPYEAQAKELGIENRLERVASPPFPDLPAFLGTADLCANPRIDADGMPVKLMNYLAAGRPVVSFEGAAPGLVDGREALLVPDGDIHGFAEAMRRLLTDWPSARALGTRGREHALKAYRWDASARQLEDLFRRLQPQRHQMAMREPAAS